MFSRDCIQVGGGTRRGEEYSRARTCLEPGTVRSAVHLVICSNARSSVHQDTYDGNARKQAYLLEPCEHSLLEYEIPLLQFCIETASFPHPVLGVCVC